MATVPRTRGSASAIALRVAPYALFAYPFAGAAIGRSEVPLIAGRYSPFLAALLVIAALVFAGAAWAIQACASRLEQGALAALVLVTYTLPGSNTVRALPLIGFVLPAVRALAALALVANDMRAARQRAGRAGPALAAGVLLGAASVGDAWLARVATTRPMHAAAGDEGLRVPYALDALATDGVVLIGDSFVWGEGVALRDRFGDRLERRYAEHGVRRPVYSLGLIGSSVPDYARILRRIPARPRTGRIVLAYYMNDMPPRARVSDRLRDQFIALGVGAPTLRVIGDSLARAATPTVDEYHRSVISDYDAHDPTFQARWALLRSQFAEFARLASERTTTHPVLLLLPLVVDFDHYPLEDAHARLRALGERLGFQVVDVLPAFRAGLGDGRRHRAGPNENHFDAASHALVAEVLEAAL